MTPPPQTRHCPTAPPAHDRPAQPPASPRALIGSGNGSTITVDDFYLFDTAESSNNAVLLSNPRVETTVPTGDSTTAFLLYQPA